MKTYTLYTTDHQHIFTGTMDDICFFAMANGLREGQVMEYIAPIAPIESEEIK